MKPRYALLLDETPLLVRPQLAVAVGLNEAILLQQLHYMLQNDRAHRAVELDGHRWIRISLPSLATHFPFWSEATTKRAVQNLRTRGLILTSRGRESNTYAIDYITLDDVASAHFAANGSDQPSGQPPGQIDPTERPHARTRDSTERSKKREEAATSAAGGEDHLPGMEPPPPPPAPTDERIEAVWAHYAEVFGDRLRVKELTPPRRRMIGKALKAVTDDVDMCNRAIDGLHTYRRRNPQGSQDVQLSVIFETGPHSKSNLTDQIEWWASQADAPSDGNVKLPLDLSGVPPVTAGMVRTHRENVRRMYDRGDLATEFERAQGHAGIDWLRETAGHEPIIDGGKVAGWRGVTE